VKRSSDKIDNMIAEWQRMRSEFGSRAPAMLSEIIDAEIRKLDRERARSARPQSGGQRSTDGWPA